MRTCLMAIIIMALFCTGIVRAQTIDCTVIGYLFNPDGSPAALAQVNVVSVVRRGPSAVLTPGVLNTDATGFTSFTAPRQSTVWIAATALGLRTPGDVAILIPEADSATLDILAQSARPPVSGFNLTSGSHPTLVLSLQDFGINLNIGPSPLPLKDPGTALGAVNSSSAQVDGARPSSDGIRQGLAAQQTAATSEDIVTTGSYRFQFPATSHGNAQWVSAETVGDASAADVHLAISSTPNPGSSRSNVVTSWGYNNNGDGVRVVAAEPALDYRIESFYSPSAGKEYMESHLQYQSTMGKVVRPFAVQIDRRTDASSVQIQTDGFSYLGPDETQYVKFMPHGVYFLNRTSLVSYVNSHPFLQQMNAAGNHFVNLAYLDSADRIQLGGGAAATDVVVSGSNLYVGSQSGVKLTNFGGAGLRLSGSNGGGAFLAGATIAGDPAPPTAGGWKMYAKNDGTGRTQLCVKFATGSPQCFARQP